MDPRAPGGDAAGTTSTRAGAEAPTVFLMTLYQRMDHCFLISLRLLLPVGTSSQTFSLKFIRIFNVIGRIISQKAEFPMIPDFLAAL